MIKPGAIRVSQSSINTWRRCKKEYYYKFILKIEKKVPPAPLYKGKIIHELIEARINGESWEKTLEPYLEEFDKLFDEEKLLYGDLRTDIPTIMKGYDDMWKDEDLEYLELQGKRAEFDFAIPLDGKPLEESDLVFTGKIDTVVKDPRERVWLMEHKSFKRLPSENFRFANQQALLYAWVLPQIGFPKPTGILWDYLRTKTPTIPKVLKSGELSKAKNIDTTPAVYKEAILENGLDPEEYQEMLDSLKGKELDFYRRIYLPVKENMIESVVQDLKETALEIQILHETTQARNLGRDCDWCSFKNLCQTELQGLDTEFILKSDYRPSTYHLNLEEEEHVEEED